MYKNLSFLIIGVIAFMQACNMPPPECQLNPINPEIEYKDFVQNEDGSGVLTVEFYDCDGDIGIEESDETSRNLILTYYELKNGIWEAIPTMIPFEYRIPDIEPQGKQKYIAGEIEVIIEPFYYNFLSKFEAVKFEIMLIDKAGNESKTITTGKLIVP